MADPRPTNSHADHLRHAVELRRVAMDLDPARLRGPVRLRHLEVIVRDAAFGELVAAGANRAGLKASGSLGQNQIEIAVSVSLFRVRVVFGASVADGLMVLTPRGGLPGWLVGQAANLVSRNDGLSMSRDGRVTVDPTPFLPPGIWLRHGFTGVTVGPEAVIATLG